ncbi:MAG: hypothetical protein KFF73_16495 [Cyclobacteriaceae bacterium]|nr:hypothetical protein [Cyclobacteriaceae bacterium]
MRKHIFIRTDANVTIGFGHLSRCLILADELIKFNFKITFLFHQTDDQFRIIIREKGFDYLDLKKGSSREIFDLMNPRDPDTRILIFDTDDKGYYDPETQQDFINRGIKLVFFTFWDQHHYLAHIIINQNPISLSRSYQTAEYTKKLLGPEYMIFNDQMIGLSRSRHVQKGSRPPNLLIAFGGSDQPDRTLKTLKAIQRLNLDIQMINIVIGSLYPYEERLMDYLSSFLYPYRLHKQARNMAEIMLESGLAICAGGLTLWELALFEIPSAILSWSERETLTAEYLHQAGLGYHLGSIKSLKLKELSLKIANFAGDRAAEKRITRLKNRINVDGKKMIALEINNLYPDE